MKRRQRDDTIYSASVWTLMGVLRPARHDGEMGRDRGPTNVSSGFQQIDSVRTDVCIAGCSRPTFIAFANALGVVCQSIFTLYAARL